MASARSIVVGGVPIGGGAPVSVQSMTTTKTHDVDATLAQIDRLREAGVDIVRVAVPGIPDADALPAIVARRRRADHRRHPLQRLAGAARRWTRASQPCASTPATSAATTGSSRSCASAPSETGTPLRIGANSGSLPEHLRWTATADPVGALVRAAMEEVELLERLDFHDFKISVKSSSVPVMIEAYRRLAAQVDYPLHLGVTEAGHAARRAPSSRLDRDRRAARARHRRHDPRLAHDRPGRGGARRPFDDPAGPRAAQVRPDADRLPVVRPHERRGARARARGASAA